MTIGPAGSRAHRTRRHSVSRSGSPLRPVLSCRFRKGQRPSCPCTEHAPRAKQRQVRQKWCTWCFLGFVRAWAKTAFLIEKHSFLCKKINFLWRLQFSLPQQYSICRAGRGDFRQVWEKRCIIMFNKTKLLSKLCPWLLPCVAYIFRVAQKHIFHKITYIFQTKNEFLCRRRFSLPTDNSTCRTARGDARQVCEKRCTITQQKKVLPSKL